MCLCNDCVIEFHSDHMPLAKLKIDEILTRGRDEVKNFSIKIENLINSSLIGKKIDEKSQIFIKKLDDNCTTNEKLAQNLYLKLDNLLENQNKLLNELKTHFKKQLEELLNNSNYKKIQESKILN